MDKAAKIGGQEAQPPAQPVMWQYRWLNPENDPDVPQSMLDWETVRPRDLSQSMDDRLQELRGYRYNGKLCYEVRPLYAAPPEHSLGMVNPWRDSIDHQLATCHLGTVETFGSDPARCLHELLTWHQQVALDPAVSSDAQALIDRGRNDAAAIVRQLVEALETCRIRSVSEWGVRHVTPIMITGAIKAAQAWLEGK